MIKKINVCVNHEEYCEKVYVSRPEIIKSFIAVKGLKRTNGILEVNMSIFNDEKDWVVIKGERCNQHVYKLKTVLGDFIPFPVVWRRWVEGTVLKAEEFAIFLRIKDKKLKKLVSYYLRKTAKNKIVSSAEVLQSYLKVNKEFRHNWTQIYYQKIYLLREVARVCGQLTEYDNYIDWHTRPTYIDYRKNLIKPSLEGNL